ncbi:hypothetical protein ACLB1R_29820 [Escherichia coli]
MPDATLARLIRPTNSRTLRSIRQRCQMPDATLARLIRPTNSRTIRRPDKAFTPHPATADCLMRRLRVDPGLQIPAPSVGRIRRLRRIRQQRPLPDATLARLIRPTNSRTLRRPDKAFTPHPATVPTA